MNPKLYRLKSNKNTVVIHLPDSKHVKVVWSERMEIGVDDRWMMFSFDADNVEPLSAEEEQQIKDKTNAFLKNKFTNNKPAV
jgi:hypothetical protein